MPVNWIEVILLWISFVSLFWLISGIVLFVLLLLTASNQHSEPANEAEDESPYQTIHNSSSWSAGFFACIIFGPIGLVLYFISK